MPTIAATHTLKCLPEYFHAIEAGDKTFEVRRFDRPFRPGDEILLREWDPLTEDYTGRSLSRRICYILTMYEVMAMLGEDVDLGVDIAILGLRV